MKICFILENYYPRVGGHEKAFLNLARGLIEKGHQVRVATQLKPGYKSLEDYKGIKIYRYKWTSLFGHAIPFFSIVGDIKEHVKWADIVHTSTYSAAPPALKIAKKYDKPCVLTVHEYLGPKWYWITNPLLALSFQLFEKWVVHKDYAVYHAISQATKNDMVAAGISKNMVKRIYLGTDDLEFGALPKTTIKKIFGLNKDDIVFLFFGRYGKPKGIPVLLRAIQKLDQKINPNVKFCFIVDQVAKLKTDFVRLGLSRRCLVKYHLPWKKLLAGVQTSDVVIVPSYTEGFGFTTTETCALGVPIIASNAGSIPEVIWGNHLLFENRNSGDLARKINLALKGKFNYRDKRKLKWQNFIDDMEGTYRQIVR